MFSGIVQEYSKSVSKETKSYGISLSVGVSKKFTKEICKKYDIPTAKFKTFDDETSALKYLKEQLFPIVIKAVGLAAGKGVIIAESYKEAEKAVKEIFSGLFNDAGKEIVV